MTTRDPGLPELAMRVLLESLAAPTTCEERLGLAPLRPLVDPDNRRASNVLFRILADEPRELPRKTTP